MLVLGRKVGERVMIGEGVSVVVLSAQGGKVRLGIVAPHEVAVRRGELARQVEEASASPAPVLLPATNSFPVSTMGG